MPARCMKIPRAIARATVRVLRMSKAPTGNSNRGAGRQHSRQQRTGADKPIYRDCPLLELNGNPCKSHLSSLNLVLAWLDWIGFTDILQVHRICPQCGLLTCHAALGTVLLCHGAHYHLTHVSETVWRVFCCSRRGREVFCELRQTTQGRSAIVAVSLVSRHRVVDETAVVWASHRARCSGCRL